MSSTASLLRSEMPRPSIDTVSLPAGDALRIRVTLDLNTGSSSSTIHETIYFVTVGRTTWAILGVSLG